MRILVTCLILALTSCVTTVERVEYRLPHGPVSILEHAVKFDDPELRCSGVYIKQDGEHKILTARHCVGKSKYYIVNLGDQQCVTEVEKLGAKVDLALLTFECNLPGDRRPAKLALYRPGLMEWVWISGRPLMFPERPIHGTVCRYDDRLIANMEIDTHIWPGNSGGGVYNQRGELVGIATMMLGVYGHPTNYGYAISIDKIHAFLAE